MNEKASFLENGLGFGGVISITEIMAGTYFAYSAFLAKALAILVAYY